MSNNLQHIDKRLAEQEAKRKEAEENADYDSFKSAELEIDGLAKLRKFYEGETL